MNTSRRSLLSLLSILLCTPRLAGCIHYPITKASAMSKAHWTTHCVGRFLLDLPPDATLGYRTDLWNRTLQREDLSIDAMHKEADRFVHEVKSQSHQNYTNRFIRRVDLPNGGIAIYYYTEEYSTLLASAKVWLIPTGSSTIFSWHAHDKIRPSTIDTSSIPFLHTLAERLRERHHVDLAWMPGFCVSNGGFIIGESEQSEAFHAGIHFSSHPGIVFSMDSYVLRTPPSTTLLERIGLIPGLLAALSGARTLRKGKRNIGPIHGEEYLLVTTQNGIIRPSFMWDVPGKVDSIHYPRLRAALNFTDESIKTSPFTSDKQVLELWDTLIQSIRPRLAIL